ncbi:hypothetical protein SEPCBS57363_000399 [Sporothrix epigloea]|uniref:Uncharacterized protein n=1 Tax=Sporothrix epigloea TaxID=1892477 RepID=A0ABP0D4H9_9PEZI
MPSRLRLARVATPNRKPWQRILTGCISPAAADSQGPWMTLGSRCPSESRTWSFLSPQREQERHNTPGKPSIFEELFPDEALASPRGKVPSSSVTTGNPPGGAETNPLFEDVWQSLESEGAAKEARTGEDGIGSQAWSSQLAPSIRKKRFHPTVLVLSGTTASLLPSDFFRIAPRVSSASKEDSAVSQPVDGWAASNGGIYKIVQDRDPVTLSPRGRYFLYFGSSAAALAYAQEVRDLHTLARRAVQPPQLTKIKARRRHKQRKEDEKFRGEGIGGAAADDGESAFVSLAGTISSGGSGAGSDAYLVSSASEEEMAALNSFSLLAPTAHLDLVMQMPAGTASPGTSSTLSPSSSSSYPSSSSASLSLYDEEQLDDVAAIDATTKVLVALEDTSSSGGNILGWTDVDGNDSTGVTTIKGLRNLIEEDGVRRNLPWAVSDGLNGVVPVQWLVAEQKRLLHAAVKASRKRQQDADRSSDSQPSSEPSPTPPPVALWASRVPDLLAKTEQMNENARYSRYVVSFADAVEARRFVRNWHRRSVSLPGTRTSSNYEQTVILNTTVLW